MSLRRLALAAAAVAFAVAAFAQASDPVAVPKLAAHVTDETATLSPAQRDALERKLGDFEHARGSQVAVLLVPTTGTEPIEEFAGRVTDAWALGRKGVDDGVLFVIAKQDRRMRIQTGRGVQGTLTDALSKRIVSDVVAPRLREGDYAGGIDAGVDAILKAIEGEALPAPARGTTTRHEAAPSFEHFLVLGFFLVPIVASVLRSVLGRLLGAGATSALTGFAAWIFFGSVVLGAAAAFAAFLFTLVSGAGFARSVRGGGWGGSIPGGGWGGGSWGGGGGGGFSGGGGSFDGGGASGSW